jgi:soluble lytic murein transglycosylase
LKTLAQLHRLCAAGRRDRAAGADHRFRSRQERETDRVLRRLLTSALAIIASSVSVATDAASVELSADQIRRGREAFHAIAADRWSEARTMADAAGDPVLAKLVLWFEVTREDSDVPFDEIARFLAESPSWPQQSLLRRRAEEAISPAMPAQAVLGWFGNSEPATANGAMQLARALLAVGDESRAREVARRGWHNASFGADEETEFLRTLGHLIVRADHKQRLDNLLWKARGPEITRMLPRVDPGQQALAMARLTLREMKPGGDRAVAKVPEALRNQPGLVYERVRWRRKKGFDADARDLLRRQGHDETDPERWGDERRILARRALDDGKATEAYRIIKAHQVKSGADFAESEWLAGWVALRYLRDPKLAGEHFQALYQGSGSPISRARGAYWSAKAADLRGQPEQAREWLVKAAGYPTAFYGQLAAARLRPGEALALPQAPAPAPDVVAEFERHELTRAVRTLLLLDQEQRIDPFLVHLATLRDSAGWRSLAAGLAKKLGRLDLAVTIAKEGIRSGEPLINEGYPALPVPRVVNGIEHEVEVPLVLAIVRQESAYKVDAVSPAGARGLMQLMPQTARHVAGTLSLPFSPTRLTTDPEYNLALGQAYIGDMLDRFDGSYLLALSAYNAGPQRAYQWRQENGDPRQSVDAAVDWLERIPFGETRNYVQRTLEHLQVYRQLMSGSGPPLGVESDLKR